MNIQNIYATTSDDLSNDHHHPHNVVSPTQVPVHDATEMSSIKQQPPTSVSFATDFSTR